ncbi:methionyl-tRNA formyltransferase [bacterium]|nr:methionyl-tRNA formyltransferase [bacterium]
MRIVYIGTVEFSRKTLEKLINLKANVVGVLTKEKSSFNSDFVDLSDICRQNNIPYKHVKDINSLENVNWIKKLKPEITFCFGFSQLLKKEILEIPTMGVLGFHPAQLPKNRGRHPIIWPLILGLEKTASTFFFMDERADSGDVLSQIEIGITYEDDARTLYDKVTETALKQIEEFLPKLQDNNYTRISQDHSKANSWRKRHKRDGKIDFRMGSRAVYNLVRGLTKPYVGAHVFYKSKEVKVWQVKEVGVKLPNIEYGKVLDVKNNEILVKCYDNAVLLVKHEFEEPPEPREYFS